MESQARHYEFDAGQNETIRKAATWSGVLAWIMMVSAGLMALGGVLSRDESAIGAVIVAAIYFVIGLYLRGAAVSMQAVVQTAGNDIEHLMIALDKLGSAFKVIGILFLLGAILFVVAIVALGAWMTSLPS